MNPSSSKHIIPQTGWKGFIQNWRNDFIAAFSVAMVALPLGLGIAQACEFPPISGVLSAIIGGLITTFIRSSHLGINGPTAGLITIILGTAAALEDGSGRTINYVLAVFVVAGVIQTILGLLKLGKLGEVFPSSVINGVLAAIGIIIFVTQLDDALGFTYSADAVSTLQKILEIPFRLGTINPLVALIGIAGLIFLILFPRINNHLIRFIPAPMWVLLMGVAIVMAFGFHTDATFSLGISSFAVGPSYLITIPDDLTQMFIFPDFAKIGDPKFWIAVLSVVLIASIESLASSKAVDKLDPYRRKTNLNKDLVGIGISTIVAGMIGALPIITVIVRSSVNVNNHARTKFSNFFHGAILILFILLLAPLIQKVPLAALGAILVFTGYRLAGPTLFKHTAMLGWEQLLFLISTVIATLAYNLLWGVFIGMGVTLLYHLIASRLTLKEFAQFILHPSMRMLQLEDGRTKIKIRGLANFFSIRKLQDLLSQTPPKQEIEIDLSEAHLIDLTVMEQLQDFSRSYTSSGGKVNLTGIELHDSTSDHPLALQTLPTPRRHPLTKRQIQLKLLAQSNGWAYQHEIKWDNSYLQNFHFFETRPVEYKENAISGKYEELGCEWEIADITFDEGALLATEVYHSTVEVLRLPFTIPEFTLEKEGRLDKIFDRVMKFVGYEDIDFELFPSFSDQFLLLGPNEKEIRSFFTPSMIRFLEDNDIYHIESNGEALMIFRRLRLAQSEDITRMIAFCKKFVKKIKDAEK